MRSTRITCRQDTFGRREMAEKVVPTLVQEGETVALPDVEEDDDWYQD